MSSNQFNSPLPLGEGGRSPSEGPGARASTEDIAIRVSNLSKCYQIYDNPRDRLKQFVMPRLRRLTGKASNQYYREFWALKDVSFEIKKGETVGIIGRNGSGKSTLLQLICGTLNPTSGSIQTKGRIAALLELGSGFNTEFTGRENVILYASILGLTEKVIQDRYDEILAFADIGSFIDQPLKTYSSGMVVRLAFATAIHVDPEILVVDEALAVGDTAFQQKCLSRIRKMQRDGVSIILVTHSSNAVVEYCDRGIFLKRGQLVLDGACRDVIKLYADDLVQDEGGAVSADSLDQIQIDVPIIEISSVVLVDEHDQSCAAVTYGSVIGVRVNITVRQVILEPCFGIQLSSVDGIVLWSCSTQSIGLKLDPLLPGNHFYTWNLNVNFAGNRYVFAIGVGEIVNGEYKRYHRLDYAGHFDVIPVPHSGAGWLSPMPKFGLPTNYK